MHILESFRKKAGPVGILPHQLASLDFIYTQLTDEKKNILMFHEMGSGKTIISLLLSFILTQDGKKVYIVLPNNNILDLWRSKLNLVRGLLPFSSTYNTFNIFFETKKELFTLIEDNLNHPEKIKQTYYNSVFLFDEAHNILGNSGAEKLIWFQELYADTPENRPNFVFVTGSPITNTLLTVSDLYSILTNKKVLENEFVIQEGNKIYNHILKDEAIDVLKKGLAGQITFYKHKDINIPELQYVGDPIIEIPVIICKMSKLQTQNYDDIRSQINNEMFLKYLLDSSFTAMGNIDNIKDFEKNSRTRDTIRLTDTLSFSNGRFHGEELYTLDNSCKLKRFVEEKIKNINNRSKTFIYFSNARIGGQFINDVMKAQGVQMYGEQPLENFVCFYCGKKRKCETCKPLKYISITSINATYLNKNNNNSLLASNHSTGNINRLINIYNMPENENGEEVCFLFGSKIISESYTLLETRDIWFLTVPDSLSEMSQIMARCLRSFSYKDTSIPVKVNMLISVQNSFNPKQLLEIKKNNSDEYINNLVEKQSIYSFDLKKILYLEIKSSQTERIHDIFKGLSINYDKKPNPVIMNLFMLEVLRLLSYNNVKFSINDIKNALKSLDITKEEISEHIDRFKEDGVILFNKFFKQVIMIQDNDDPDIYYLAPVKVSMRPFVYSLDI